MTVVERRILYLPYLKSRILSSSREPSICPFVIIILAFFPRSFSRSFWSVSRVAMRLWINKTCHPRANSNSIACFIERRSNLIAVVLMAFFNGGGVMSTEIFRTPLSARFRLRGIGVAERLKISRFDLRAVSFSLSITQNLCSSSTIRSPRFWNEMSGDKRRWVPTTQWIVPFASHFRVSFSSFCVLTRDNTAIFTQKSPRRFDNDSKCSIARTTRGEISMDCFRFKKAR